MNWKNIPVSKEFYDENHDPESDCTDSAKCNNGCGETVIVEGDVCQACYAEEV